MLVALPGRGLCRRAAVQQLETTLTEPSRRPGAPVAPVPTAKRRWRTGVRRTAPFAGGVVAALVAVALWSAVFPPTPSLTTRQVNDAIASALASVTPPPAFSETAWQQIAPSVVLVEASGVAPAPSGSASPAASPAPSAGDGAGGAIGSGVVVDDQGDIMTALHVVAGASAITVTFVDGSTAQAVVASTHPELDIAVLQPARLPSAVHPATLGGSVRVGSEVFAVGSPFGLADSMSAGIVSALGRSFTLPSGQKLTGLIQVDAAINPGSSGGPLLNRDGQVVGIVDALVNPTKQDVFVGVGLAVPISVAGGAAGLPQY